MYFQKVVDDTKLVGQNACWASNNGKYGEKGKGEKRGVPFAIQL